MCVIICSVLILERNFIVLDSLVVLVRWLVSRLLSRCWCSFWLGFCNRYLMKVCWF